tara:strand:+ start:151 stop:693 length:543 start_codon:yes stop_codon:yes gene_type:complete
MVILTEDKICVGVIIGVRGLKGEVRVKSFTANPDKISAYGPVTTKDGRRSFQLTIKSHTKDILIARLDGIKNRDSAEKLKGEQLFVPRSALPDPEIGEFYQADLIGLYVETDNGERVGIIEAIHNFGASDILEISCNDQGANNNIMIPFTREMVPIIDIKVGRIVVNLPTYFDLDEPKKN